MALGIHGKQLRDSTIEREKLSFAITGTPIIQYNGDYNLSPLPTSGNNSPTGLFLTEDPYLDSGIYVFVNGQIVELGDGDKTKDCYFTNDAGTTADLIKDIGTFSHLYWNGLIATYDLTTDDVISFQYEITSNDIIVPVVAGITGPPGPPGVSSLPGGNIYNVQYNDGFGNFAGSDDFTWDQSTKILKANNLQLSNNIIKNSNDYNIITMGSGVAATTTFSGAVNSDGVVIRNTAGNRIFSLTTNDFGILVSPGSSVLSYINVNTDGYILGGFRIEESSIERLVLHYSSISGFVRLGATNNRLLIGNGDKAIVIDPTTGYTFMGGTNPTSVTKAILEIGANNSGYSSPFPAQLKMSVSVTPTTLADGEMWYSGSGVLNLYNGTTSNAVTFGTGATNRLPIWSGTNTLSSDSGLTFVTNVLNTPTLRLNSNIIQNSTGNSTITMATGATGLVTLSGSLRINGNTILNSAGSTVMTMSGTNLIVAGNLQVTGNIILNSAGSTVMTMSGTNLIVAGNLQANGNNILNSAGSAVMTMSGTDLIVANNLRVNGNNILNSAGSAVMTMSGTDLIVANNLRVNGNNILNSAGTTVMTMTGTIVTVAGFLQIVGNNIQNSTGNSSLTIATGSAPLITLLGSLKIVGNNIQNSSGTNIITFGASSLTTLSGSLQINNNLIQNTSAVSVLSWDSDSTPDLYHRGWRIGQRMLHGLVSVGDVGDSGTTATVLFGDFTSASRTSSGNHLIVNFNSVGTTNYIVHVTVHTNRTGTNPTNLTLDNDIFVPVVFSKLTTSFRVLFEESGAVQQNISVALTLIVP